MGGAPRSTGRRDARNIQLGQSPLKADLGRSRTARDDAAPRARRRGPPRPRPSGPPTIPMRLLTWAAVSAVACVLLALSRASDVHAGTVRRFGLADLAEHADLAFEGRVLGARVLESAPGRIETEYTLREDVAHVGAPCGLRVVRVPGGVLPDGRGMAIAGLPRLEVGADVLLFLSRESTRGTRLPVGLGQGALRIVTTASGAKRLVGSSAGLDFVGSAPTAVPDGPGIDYVAGLAEIASGVAARAAEERR